MVEIQEVPRPWGKEGYRQVYIDLELVTELGAQGTDVVRGRDCFQLLFSGLEKKSLNGGHY